MRFMAGPYVRSRILPTSVTVRAVFVLPALRERRFLMDGGQNGTQEQQGTQQKNQTPQQQAQDQQETHSKHATPDNAAAGGPDTKAYESQLAERDANEEF